MCCLHDYKYLNLLSHSDVHVMSHEGVWLRISVCLLKLSIQISLRCGKKNSFCLLCVVITAIALFRQNKKLS